MLRQRAWPVCPQTELRLHVERVSLLTPPPVTMSAIAQLVEHLTVEALQQSDGPWFDSGWPDMCSGEHCSAVYPFTWLAVAQLVNRLAVDAL